MKRTTKYVALDVHQTTTVASVREEGGRVIARSVLPTGSCESRVSDRTMVRRARPPRLHVSSKDREPKRGERWGKQTALHGRHSALAELTLDRIAAFEGFIQAGDGVRPKPRSYTGPVGCKRGARRAPTVCTKEREYISGFRGGDLTLEKREVLEQ